MTVLRLGTTQTTAIAMQPVENWSRAIAECLNYVAPCPRDGDDEGVPGVPECS